MNSCNPGPRRVWTEASRSPPWSHFQTCIGNAGCVGFCTFLVSKRGRNHFRTPQDDPKAARGRLLRQGRCHLLRQDRCLLLRQDRCLLLRQDRCLLMRQDRCLLLQEQTSVLSQHTALMSQKSQLCQCHNVQVSERRSGPKSTKMARNGSRMVARS